MSPSYLIYYFYILHMYKTGTHLQHVDKIYVVSLQHFFDELDQFIFEFSFALKPRSMEV